jgi:hypothetical protein
MANDKILETFYIGHLAFEIYLNFELWHLELNFSIWITSISWV